VLRNNRVNGGSAHYSITPTQHPSPSGVMMAWMFFLAAM
jgi:hypothetical protein